MQIRLGLKKCVNGQEKLTLAVQLQHNRGVNYMAWSGKILRVNLTDGSCAVEPLNMQWAQEYLGQRGLASKYLVEEIDPKVDP
ncbi:MAG: aldehyde ferredoxin oxidoreductase N-terminal domain-containing protein, partial [Candidatus Thiodiazotropha sp. 6PDIVS]